MVALRGQGNWRWEGPLGTPLVHTWVIQMLDSVVKDLKKLIDLLKKIEKNWRKKKI